MAVRSSIAAFVGFVAFVVGSVVIAAQRGSNFGAVGALLFGRSEGASTLCMLFAWGWLIAGLLAMAGLFAAFADDDEDGHRTKIPPAAPIVLLLVAGLLLWLALGCIARKPEPAKAPTAVAAPIAPPAEDLDDALEGGDAEPAEPAPQTAAAVPARAAPAQRPPVESAETSLAWPYEYPLIRGETIVGSKAMDEAIAALMPMEDRTGEVRRMLCGKAWVAFTGSASEEGPQDRNSARARARARLIADRAEAWLERHEDCARPVVLGVDLGQHVPTDAPGPGATAYQRQVIVIGRRKATADETLTPFAALGEMRDYYAGRRSDILGVRAYRGEPSMFVASDQ